MMTQDQIAKRIGFSQPTVNLVLTGKRKISWPMAEKLSELFPEKTIPEWKKATGDEFTAAFNQLQNEDTIQDDQIMNLSERNHKKFKFQVVSCD